MREQLHGKEERSQVETSQEEASKGAEQLQRREQNLIALRRRLKRQVEGMFHIPSDYELLIEDYQENADSSEARGEANFVWVMPGTDCGISITLSEQGSLVEYSIDLEPTAEEDSMSQEELKVCAERFIEDYYPGELQAFPHIESDWKAGGCWFYYRQTAMGLPLPHSGFRIHVNGANGKVQDFKCFGKVEEPEMPGSGQLRDPNELLAEIRDQLAMELKYEVLSPGAYVGGDDGIKLVYEPAGFVRSFPAFREAKPADAIKSGQDDSGEADSVEVPPAAEEVYLPIDFSSFEGGDWPKWEDRSLEEWVGVDTARYELVREVELSEAVIGVAWQKKNRDIETKERTWSSYFADRTEGTIKAKLDKNSRRLLGFMHFTGDEDEGLSLLSRKECLRIALQYVQALTPGMLPFLRLHLNEDTDEEPGGGRKMINMLFKAYAGELPVGLESTTVAVNRNTGKVSMFMASPLKPEKLAGLSSKPAINVSLAKALYMNSLKLQLKWETKYSPEKSGRQYRLVYVLIETETGRPPRLLDAQTGDVYCSAF
ncbi:YcdB/YcdC domain-containing protein [Paenibacillus sp. CAU 1782]